MALQIRRGTSTNPTLEEGELYLNTTTGILYTLINDVVTPINADSASRAKKIFLNLKNTGVAHDDWSGSSLVYCNDPDIAAADIVVTYVGSGEISVAFTPALDQDAIMVTTQNKQYGIVQSGVTVLYYTWGVHATGHDIRLLFVDNTFSEKDMQAADHDILVVLDYLEALPT